MINRPDAITQYNKYMNGVDKGDQFSSYYSFDHRSYKVWKKIIFAFLETTLLNSVVIFKSIVGN